MSKVERRRQWERVMATETGDREAGDGFFLFRTNRRRWLCDRFGTAKTTMNVYYSLWAFGRMNGRMDGWDMKTMILDAERVWHC